MCSAIAMIVETVHGVNRCELHERCIASNDYAYEKHDEAVESGVHDYCVCVCVKLIVVGKCDYEEKMS